MRRAVSVFFAVMFLVASVAGVFAQAAQGAPGQGRPGGDGQGRGGGGRGPAAPACTTLACDVQADWDRNRDLFVNISNAMPEDKFGFKPTPAQRSYAEQVMHVVGIDIKLLSTLGGKTPAPMVSAATSKADVMAAVRQSMDYGAAVVKEFNDQQLLERVTSLPFMGPTTSRARVIYFSISHTQDIYGQMAVYLRLNGVTPPASNRGGV